MDNNYLEHYGILGMKWGVRRFQNRDGTLTPEGLNRLRKHYYKSKEQAGKLTKKYEKYSSKANKLEIKTSKLKRKDEEKYKDKIEKNENKIKKYEAKAEKLKAKAEKFIKAREKAFSKINYDSIPQDVIDKGEEFTIYINALQSRESAQQMVKAQNELLKKF